MKTAEFELRQIPFYPSSKHSYLVPAKSCQKALWVNKDTLKQAIEDFLQERQHYVYKNKKLFFTKEGALKLCLALGTNNCFFDFLYKQKLPKQQSVHKKTLEQMRTLLIYIGQEVSFLEGENKEMLEHIKALELCYKKLLVKLN